MMYSVASGQSDPYPDVMFGSEVEEMVLAKKRPDIHALTISSLPEGYLTLTLTLTLTLALTLTLTLSLPEGYLRLMQACWDHSPDERPPISRVVSELEMMAKKTADNRMGSHAEGGREIDNGDGFETSMYGSKPYRNTSNSVTKMGRVATEIGQSITSLFTRNRSQDNLAESPQVPWYRMIESDINTPGRSTTGREYGASAISLTEGSFADSPHHFTHALASSAELTDIEDTGTARIAGGPQRYVPPSPAPPT